MDEGLTVTFISVAMFVGSFLLGFIPLLFRLSEVSRFLILKKNNPKNSLIEQCQPEDLRKSVRIPPLLTDNGVNYPCKHSSGVSRLTAVSNG